MNLVETIDAPVGSYAPDFELPGIDGQVHHLRRYLEEFRAVGVIFISNHCPYVEWYLDRLKNIQAKFAPQGFTLIAMNGSDGDRNTKSSFESMKAFARCHQFNFPYLWDSTQDVTSSFGAIKTPTAFLIDTNGIVRYKGQIDDHPQNPSAVGKDYLRIAIACLFDGEKIDIPQTEPIGTTLIWRNYT